MAEYCKDCSREILGISEYKLDNAEFSEEPELCEGCGQVKPVLVALAPPSLAERAIRRFARLWGKYTKKE